jgi:hypothetical protein
MQLLRGGAELSEAQLHPAGRPTLVKMVTKGWIETARPRTYRLTPKELAAMEAQIISAGRDE